tara:strand:+ start:44 stop:271 length:228 start_codon:yes stop_codon:yes gene_type:complete
MIEISEHHLRIQADPLRLKVIAEAIGGYMDSKGMDDQTLRDFRFQMEVAYQDHNSLDQDYWGFTDKDRKELFHFK